VAHAPPDGRCAILARKRHSTRKSVQRGTFIPSGWEREGLKVRMVQEVNLSGLESGPSVTLSNKESPSKAEDQVVA
jgi:hypothetical protein